MMASIYFRKRVVLPYVHRRSKFSVVTDGRLVALKTPSGIKVSWDGDSYLEVYVPRDMKNAMRGLCGNNELIVLCLYYVFVLSLLKSKFHFHEHLSKYGGNMLIFCALNLDKIIYYLHIMFYYLISYSLV